MGEGERGGGRGQRGGKGLLSVITQYTFALTVLILFFF